MMYLANVALHSEFIVHTEYEKYCKFLEYQKAKSDRFKVDHLYGSND